MGENYLLWLAIVIITFFILNKAGRMYKVASHGNSIKLEDSMMFHAIIELIFGLAMCLVIYITGEVDDSGLNNVIMYCLYGFMGFSLLKLVYTLFVEIKDYLFYRKVSNVWILIFIIVMQNVIWAYMIYNFYVCRINSFF